MRAGVERSHDQFCRLKGRKAHPDRDVEAFGNYIDAAVSALQMHLDCEIFRHEARNQCTELEIEQSHRTSDPDHTARLRTYFGDHLLGRLGLDQHRDAAVIEFAPDLRYREAARRSVEQSHTKALL